jgi:hypothetical protein
MTAAELAHHHIRARRVGAGNWITKCPAHPDRSPSLSIREGRGGRILLRCFAGCQTADVLKALGLAWKDICGEPVTPAQAREAAAVWQEQEQHRQKQRVTERVAFDRIRKLHAIADELGSRLANDPDAPGSDAVAGLFHQTLDRLREAEAAVSR